MSLFDKKTSKNKEDKKEIDSTFVWKRYERGRDYVYKKNLIAETNKNWNFFLGNQWEGVESGSEDLPSYPFIEGVIKYKVSTVSQNNMVAKFSDLEGREELNGAYEKMNQLFSACWEKANMEQQLWSTIKDSAVTGDGIQYYGTNDVADMERIANTNIFYGDESQTDIQKQPYLILWQRRSVADVRAEAELNGVEEEQIKSIVADEETSDIIGNTDELDATDYIGDSKVTCVIYLEKKGGIVHVTKSTKNVVYEPTHPICVTNPDGTQGRGLTRYPLAKISWKDYPNDARGISEVKQMIPNQIEINKTLARRSQIIKLTAFPRIAYDGNAIANPEDLEKVGSPIEITSGGVQSVNQLIAYLNPATTNGDAKDYADDLLNMTQELAGAGETARGNIELNRVAASAVLAIRDQSALPLNEQVAKMKTFVEDLAKLWLEIWMVYNPNGMPVTMEEEDPMTGVKYKTQQMITKDELDMLSPNIRIDTSSDNPWTKESEQTWADNALQNQYITFEEYVELVPDSGIVPKAKLEALLEKRKQEQARQQLMQQQMMEQQQAEEEQRLAVARANGELDEEDDEEEPSAKPQQKKQVATEDEEEE